MNLKYICIIILFSLINVAQTTLTISGNVIDTNGLPLQADLTINQFVRGEWEYRTSGSSSINGEFSITMNNITSTETSFNYSLQYYSLSRNTFYSPHSTTARVVLYNVLGEMVIQKTLQFAPGYNELPLEINSFANGMYIRVLEISEGIISQKIVKNGSTLNFGTSGNNRIKTVAQNIRLNKNPDDSLYIMTIAESEGYIADTIITAISSNNSGELSGVIHRLVKITAKNFYPGSIGTFFTYDGISTDTNNVSTPYQRHAIYTSTEDRNEQEYVSQSNTITVGDSISSSDFLFRVSENAMFIYIDPEIFNEIIESLGIDPGLVTFNADAEVRIFNHPFQGSTSWSAFYVEASILGGLVTLDILKLEGNYLGEEQMEFMEEQVNAHKIEYVATLQLPETLDDIADPPVEIVSANAWFVQDIGIVKIEGSEFILGVIRSELKLNLDGTTVSEQLTDYQIK